MSHRPHPDRAARLAPGAPPAGQSLPSLQAALALPVGVRLGLPRPGAPPAERPWHLAASEYFLG